MGVAEGVTRGIDGRLCFGWAGLMLRFRATAVRYRHGMLTSIDLLTQYNSLFGTYCGRFGAAKARAAFVQRLHSSLGWSAFLGSAAPWMGSSLCGDTTSDEPEIRTTIASSRAPVSTPTGRHPIYIQDSAHTGHEKYVIRSRLSCLFVRRRTRPKPDTMEAGASLLSANVYPDFLATVFW